MIPQDFADQIRGDTGRGAPRGPVQRTVAISQLNRQRMIPIPASWGPGELADGIHQMVILDAFQVRLFA
jgi:hypothetical protein